MKRVAEWLGVALVCFAAAEASTRALYALRGDLAPQRDDSLRAEWRWAQRHLDANAPVLPSTHVFDPALGWSLKPHYRDARMTTNAVGMRARREFSESRVPGVPRIVLVGDSYTMGANMDDADAYHTVLGREGLPGWEVLNLGVSGYGVDQAVLRYETLGARYQPDVVVLGFFLRDHFRNLDRFRAYAKPYFTVSSGGALTLHRDHVIPPDDLFEAYRSGRRRIGGWGYSYAWAAIGERIDPALSPRRVGVDDPAWRLSAALLRRFRDRVREDGAQPVLLLIPTRPGRYRNTVYETLHTLAHGHASALDLPVVPLGEVFYADASSEPPRHWFGSAEEGHLSRAGNREMARRVAEAVRRLRPPPGASALP